MIRLALIGTALLALTTCASHEPTPSICDDPMKIKHWLESTFGERITHAFLNNAGSLLHLYASPGGDSWTLIATRQGQSCIVSSGDSIHQVRPIPFIKDQGT